MIAKIHALVMMLGIVIGISAASSSVLADEMTAAEKTQFESVIRDYLLNNPEILLESLNSFRARQEAAAEAEALQALKMMSQTLLDDPMVPKGGNEAGNITLIEFFDYRCGFCKRTFPAIQELIETDGNIRYVLKEFPILGPESVVASRYALATWLVQPEQYAAFRNAMMANRGALPTEKVRMLGTQAGVDIVAVEAALNDPKIEAAIQSTYEQAQMLKINGTPAFIVGDRIVPGAVDLDTLRQIVAEERAS